MPPTTPTEPETTGTRGVPVFTKECELSSGLTAGGIAQVTYPAVAQRRWVITSINGFADITVANTAFLANLQLTNNGNVFVAGLLGFDSATPANSPDEISWSGNYKCAVNTSAVIGFSTVIASMYQLVTASGYLL